MKAMYMINSELNGIEIYFDEKPGDIIRDELKKNRYRWNGRKKCWYAKQTDTALQLAEQLTTGRAEAAEQIKREIQQHTAAVKLTVEQMQEAASQYTFRETGEGMYAGWTGCNCEGLNLTGQKLKKAILAELKKNGIRATARSGRGYTDSFTFTIRVPQECRLSLEEYIEIEQHKTSGRFWYRDATNGKDIHRDALWDLPEEERERIIREQLTMEYNRAGVVPVDEFIKLVHAIVNSFNSDHSNGMVDYFDRGFYDWYEWKAA